MYTLDHRINRDVGEPSYTPLHVVIIGQILSFLTQNIDIPQFKNVTLAADHLQKDTEDYTHLLHFFGQQWLHVSFSNEILPLNANIYWNLILPPPLKFTKLRPFWLPCRKSLWLKMIFFQPCFFFLLVMTLTKVWVALPDSKHFAD